MNPIAFTAAFPSPRTSFGAAAVSTTPTYQHSPIPPASDTVSFGTTRVRFGEEKNVTLPTDQNIADYVKKICYFYDRALGDNSVLGMEQAGLNLDFDVFKGDESPLKHRFFSDHQNPAKLIRLYAPQVSLTGAILDHVDLFDAWMEGANLSDAKLKEADFGKANLSYAKLMNADIQGASFRRANISGADFTGATTDNDLSSWNGAYYYEGFPPQGLSKEIMETIVSIPRPHQSGTQGS